MAGSLNKVMLIGTLGKDPESRTTQNGNNVASFSMATNERFTDKQGQKVDKTEWHKIVLWGALANVAKYLRKGSSVYIEGKITTRSYEDKQNQKRYVTEIIGSSVQMLDKKESGGQASSNFATGQQQGFKLPQAEDDLPF